MAPQTSSQGQLLLQPEWGQTPEFKTKSHKLMILKRVETQYNYGVQEVSLARRHSVPGGAALKGSCLKRMGLKAEFARYTFCGPIIHVTLLHTFSHCHPPASRQTNGWNSANLGLSTSKTMCQNKTLSSLNGLSLMFSLMNKNLTKYRALSRTKPYCSKYSNLNSTLLASRQMQSCCIPCPGQCQYQLFSHKS